MSQVQLIVRVGPGKYCWDYKNRDIPSCQFFDNSGGHNKCMLGFRHSGIKNIEDEGGAIKPKECLNLTEVEGEETPISPQSFDNYWDM